MCNAEVCISSHEEGIGIGEIASRLPSDDLDGRPIRGGVLDVETSERIVDAQRTLFVSTEDEPVAELLIEAPQGDIELLAGVVGIVLCESVPFELLFVAQHGRLKYLVLKSRIEVLVRISEVEVGIYPTALGLGIGRIFLVESTV